MKIESWNVIGFCLKAGRNRILTAIGALVVVVAFTDWVVGDKVSLGVLYILPMMLGASILRPWETAMLATLCAFLRAWIDTPASNVEGVLRFVFALLAYFASGMFVTALVRNRKRVAGRLQRTQREQHVRREAEAHVKMLVETSLFKTVTPAPPSTARVSVVPEAA